MDSNLLQRQLKASKSENIAHLGNQPTGSPEFIMSKIALDYRLQKELIRPTWILALATIVTLAITLLQIYRIEQRINRIEFELNKALNTSGLSIENNT